jgi:multiple sugar transport system permease protein
MGAYRTPVEPRRDGSASRLRLDLFPYGLLLPSMVVLTVLLLYPIARAFLTSLGRHVLFRPQATRAFIGLDNYGYILSDPRIWHSLYLAALYSVVVVTGSMLVGLGTALAVRRPFGGRALYRMAIIIPWVIPPVATSLVWSWMLDYQFGVVNHLLRLLRIVEAPIGWLTTATWAMPSMFLVGIWKMYPIASVMLLAGLQVIPDELYEAARIDGASRFEGFRYVTLPGLKPVYGILALLLTLWSFKSFTYIYIMTGGGPSQATETAVVLVYLQAFKFYDFGVASALGVLMLLILVVFTVVYLKLVYGGMASESRA